jgi:hypothetical protein
MKTNFRSKLHDIINTSFSENTLNKSQKNIFIETDSYLDKKIKTSNSQPKYKNILNSYNYNNSNSNKENIQDILNRSFSELGIKRKQKIDTSSKKSIFDDIQNDTIDFIGERNSTKSFNYESIIHNIKKNNRKKTKNILLGFNNNDFNFSYQNSNYNNNNNYNNTYNNNIYSNKVLFIPKNSNNNYQLKKKLFNFANELKNEFNSNSVSYINRPVSTIQNNFITYSSPFNNGRINNLTKGNNISKIYDNDNSLQLNNRSVNKNKTIDVGLNNSRNHNKYFSNYNLKKEKKEDLIEYMKGFNLERKNLINNKNQVIKNYHGINLDF